MSFKSACAAWTTGALIAACGLALPASNAAAQSGQASVAPATLTKPTVDTYHGQKVEDPYQWLEDWSNPEVKAWSEAQNAYARSVLDKLGGVEAIRERVTAVMSAQSVDHTSLAWVKGSDGKGKLFALKRQPPKQQPFLVVMDSAFHPDTARVLVDPVELDTKGTTAIDWFIPSHDGSLVAVSISSGGSESGDVHVFDVATGKRVHEIIPRVNGGTAGGSLAWDADGKGFYYTRYPREGERPESEMDFFMQVYHHTLGQPTEKDRYETGKDLPGIAEIQLEIHPGSGRVLATVQKGDGGEFIHFLRGTDGSWRQFTQYEDRVVQARLGPEGDLYLISRKGAPRGKLLRIEATDDARLAQAQTIVQEQDDTLVADFWEPGTLAVTDNYLFLTYQLGGPSEVRIFTHKGEMVGKPRLDPVSAVSGLTPVGGGDDVLFAATSYVKPRTWSVFHPAGNGGDGNQDKTSTSETPLGQTTPFDYSGYEVTREFAVSKDGTRVPVNIVRRKGVKLDGTNPTLLTGYGGYGVNIEPRFRPAQLVLLEKGFVFAEANIRGGGEFGGAWHTGGNLLNKQNVFDDFAAAARHLIERGYTTTPKLAIEGGSNGGLMMGAMMTQHPELFACVIGHVGIYDMLRVELSANGAFNIPEFGSVKDPAQFKALFAYSPYHHVREGVKYPPVLFMTGANDPRVDPMQSRKMTARLQSVGGTALLRTSASSGHGMGSSLNERIEQSVDGAAFLFYHLGVK